MNKTKKGFLIAGGILAILSAVVMILVSFIFISVQSLEEMAIETEGYTEEEMQLVKDFALIAFHAIGYFMLTFSVVNLILGIAILVKTNHETIGKGLIITELVFAIFGSGLLVVAFMIVALCIKDQPTDKTVDTIEI